MPTLKPLDCIVPGPHRVGVVTLELADARVQGRKFPLDVWYPVDPARLDPDVVPGNEQPMADPYGPGHLDAPPARGPFPLIAFSHGNGGVRRQSTFLTTHLASFGFVVVSPDHVGNTLFDAPAQSPKARRQRHREVRGNRPRDLEAAIATALTPDPRWPAVDAGRIGVLGHSFGGWTALKMPLRDPRIRAVCGLAPTSEPFVGRHAFEPGELPFERPIPTLLVAGIDDVLVDLETSVRPLFERLAPPTALVGVERLDHFHFCNGIEFLHGRHYQNPRENQPRPTRPYPEQLDEARTHRVLRGVVTAFLLAALQAEADPLEPLAPAELSALDPALQRLG